MGWPTTTHPANYFLAENRWLSLGKGQGWSGERQVNVISSELGIGGRETCFGFVDLIPKFIFLTLEDLN